MTDTTNAPATTKPKELTASQSLRFSLEKMAPEFKKVLPKHVTEEKFMRTIFTALQTNPKLAECNSTKVIAACMKAAADGLLPDGKEAALIPMGSDVVYVPMVAGILKKVRNSGELASISASIVHKEDDFKYWIDETGEHIEFKPDHFGERGEPIGAFAIAKTKDGATYFEIMSQKQIMDVKNSGRAKNSGPWGGPFEDQMWIKSCIRRLSKRLPMSTDLEQTLSRDDELYNFDNEPPAKIEPKTKSSRLSKAMGTVEEETEEGEIVPPTTPVSEADTPL